MTSTPEELALRAKEFLGNEAFKHVIERAKADVLAASLSCNEKDDIGRFRLLTALKVIDRIVPHLSVLLQALPEEARPDPNEFYNERAQSKLSALLSTLKS